MKALWIVLAVIIAAGIVWYFVSYDNPGTNSYTNTTSNSSIYNYNTNTTSTNSSENTNAAPVVEGGQVSITSAGFDPATVTINAGESVTWTNKDTASHAVAPDNHPTHVKYAGIWDYTNMNLKNGETYTNTFMQTGTYSYHDPLEETVKGTVVVE